MKKIIIEIPEDEKNKNWVFSSALDILRNDISQDETLEGKLAPLWRTKLISEYNLIKSISQIIWSELSWKEFSTLKDEFEWENWKIEAIRWYMDISKSKVYLVQDITGLRDYIISKVG
jgi:hypothetical protein